MGIVSKLFHALFNNLRQNKTNPLTGDSLKQVLVSAMYAEQQSAYLNSYETGIAAADGKKILQEYWAIYDKADAEDTLSYLLHEGHSYYFEPIYKALTTEKGNYAAYLESAFPPEELEKAVNLFRGLRSNIDSLINDKVISRIEDLQVYKVHGWDYGRLSFMTRLCYEHNLISEHVMKQFLRDGLEGTKRAYTNWTDFSKGYIIGRAMWGGDNNSGMTSIAQSLLTNKKSPWVNHPL
ncbi:DUF1266 domain-containing protein [Polluticaenibacter yanchengensis]|uniref:DUF1266 domain-containing protein n=1 Tax=Polluticaenibacter yanchengensis TaxID=3014562 RepID=A0ABT4UFN2_9BACT|nr:DUF1266 domain-containing protein [Chitinophagaceae bacterium LY-5]